MTPQDEKDLQQILFLAGRILERQHLSDERSYNAPALIYSRDNATQEITTPTNDGIIIPFPSRRADGAQPLASAERSQEETTLLFSVEEVSKMPRKFRKIFRTNKQTAHVRRKDGDVYEIRMQLDGHRITASAKYLDLAKERFIKKLREYNEYGRTGKKETAQSVPDVAPLSVSDYALHYLQTFKRPNISEKHFSNLCGIVNQYHLKARHR